MVFSSEVFLLLFLPLFLGLYYIVPRVVRIYLILAGSLIFYGWLEPLYLALLLIVIVTTYYAGIWASNNKHAGEQSNASNENRGHAHHGFGDLLRLGVGLHAFGLRRSLKQ